MEIFRIENYRGFGPYSKGSHFCFDMQNKHGIGHDLYGRHPVEGGDDSDEDAFIALRWGFVCMFDLCLWFDSFGQTGYDYLIKRGFHIAVYYVEEHLVRVHTRQVTFCRRSARILRTETLKSFNK